MQSSEKEESRAWSLTIEQLLGGWERIVWCKVWKPCGICGVDPWHSCSTGLACTAYHRPGSLRCILRSCHTTPKRFAYQCLNPVCKEIASVRDNRIFRAVVGEKIETEPKIENWFQNLTRLSTWVNIWSLRLMSSHPRLNVRLQYLVDLRSGSSSQRLSLPTADSSKYQISSRPRNLATLAR